MPDSSMILTETLSRPVLITVRRITIAHEKPQGPMNSALFELGDRFKLQDNDAVLMHNSHV